MAFQDYFSVVAFFIFLRETLEAAVIIAVLLQCMNRTAPMLKKQGKQGTQQRSFWSNFQVMHVTC
jgi:high-affinity Fe2+/Pb2+ permease